MKVGLATIFAWRPHVEHAAFLGRLLERAGHSVSALSCDGCLSACHPKLSKPSANRIVLCTACSLGGLRSYAVGRHVSLRSYSPSGHLDPGRAIEWAGSSASTIGRFESDEDYASPEFTSLRAALAEGVSEAYLRARTWIESEKLEHVMVFNGRADATRAVVEAAIDMQVPFSTFERAWFGNGIQVLPGETCLGLHAKNAFNRDWRGVPLTHRQARRAARLVAARFLKRNESEWRAYNVNPESTRWPTSGTGPRVLFLPGSRNEVWGHRDWENDWSTRADAFSAVVEHLRLPSSSYVLRCHPNWAESIAGVDGKMPERYYLNWARRHGVEAIPSASRADTNELIASADVVVLMGGSAALEAASLGKTVLALGPSIYSDAGFEFSAYGPEALMQFRLSDHRSAHEVRLAALRFAYTQNFRVIQYVREVRRASDVECVYVPNPDPSRLVSIVRDGVLTPDDAEAGHAAAGEESVLAAMEASEWGSLSVPDEYDRQDQLLALPPRRAFAAVHALRRRLRRGDLA